MSTGSSPESFPAGKNPSIHQNPEHLGFWTIRRSILAILAVVLAGGVFFGWRFYIAVATAREHSAEAYIFHLAKALEDYKRDQGAYPSGDGIGSRDLVAQLQKQRPQGFPYYPLDPECLKNGHLVNPVDAEKVFYYRSPGIHNPKTFDLWCEDSKGRADSINNWQH